MGEYRTPPRTCAFGRGYTLFEVNLAIAILTAALLTSIYMVRNSSTFVRSSGDLTLASQIVESQLDEAHVSDIYSLIGTSAPTYFNRYGIELDAREPGGNKLPGKYVSQSVGTLRGSYLEIVVIVAWFRDGALAPEDVDGSGARVKRVQMSGRVIAK